MEGKPDLGKVKPSPGLKEYQESFKQAAGLINRLKMGGIKINQALQENNSIEAKKLQKHWMELARVLYGHLELMLLIQEQYVTGKSIVLTTKGGLKKVEDIMNMEPEEMDVFSLLSVQKFYDMFGPEYTDLLEIKTGEQSTPF